MNRRELTKEEKLAAKLSRDETEFSQIFFHKKRKIQEDEDLCSEIIKSGDINTVNITESIISWRYSLIAFYTVNQYSWKYWIWDHHEKKLLGILSLKDNILKAEWKFDEEEWSDDLAILTNSHIRLHPQLALDEKAQKIVHLNRHQADVYDFSGKLTLSVKVPKDCVTARQFLNRITQIDIDHHPAFSAIFSEKSEIPVCVLFYKNKAKRIIFLEEEERYSIKLEKGGNSPDNRISFDVPDSIKKHAIFIEGLLALYTNDEVHVFQQDSFGDAIQMATYKQVLFFAPQDFVVPGGGEQKNEHYHINEVTLKAEEGRHIIDVSIASYGDDNPCKEHMIFNIPSI